VSDAGGGTEAADGTGAPGVLLDTVAAAARAARDGGAPFAAAIVLDGVVVGFEANAVGAALDPTAHAEVCAIRSACRSLGTADLSGAVLYSSCEPCLMCAASALWAGIRSVVYAAPIEAVTGAPLARLFPPGSVDWSLLPLDRELVRVEAAERTLAEWRP
jgi:tRNA(Arg) A34 adenosine deaminase TadA